ncbi:hypothetical protein EVAR_14654_1 [Eumeta japonica]|uniref:Uncharacterized protein n=1 Tax=Eumeta variegata TaxID=151549 RepID=A0A4C1U220_EUMVA|nr:hypothetical protein EVAR_14654_1 [Eumeta japonica]
MDRSITVRTRTLISRLVLRPIELKYKQHKLGGTKRRRGPDFDYRERYLRARYITSARRLIEIITFDPLLYGTSTTKIFNFESTSDNDENPVRAVARDGSPIRHALPPVLHFSRRIRRRQRNPTVTQFMSRAIDPERRSWECDFRETYAVRGKPEPCRTGRAGPGARRRRPSTDLLPTSAAPVKTRSSQPNFWLFTGDAKRPDDGRGGPRDASLSECGERALPTLICRSLFTSALLTRPIKKICSH